MKESIEAILSWGYPLVSLIAIVWAATRRGLPGRAWIIAHLAIGLTTMLAWRIPSLLSKFDSFDLDTSNFYDLFSIPIRIVGLAGFVLLLPFISAVAGPHRSYPGSGAGAGELQNSSVTADTTNPLYGVHGWLKFFVIMNMYIAPVLFGVLQVLGFIGFSILAEDYPGIVVVGLIEAAVGCFFVVKWIMIARRLRDVARGAVQEAKLWLLISLAWNILSTPLVFMSGMDAEDLIVGTVKGLVMGIIAFAIWYSYFNVSKRVKATYPDWDT